MTKPAPKVAWVERILTHYRVKVYEEVRLRLAREGIQFLLIYGQPTPDEAKKNDTVSLGSGLEMRNAYLPGNLVWQPCWSQLKDCDLVIVDQANRLLLNYLLLASRWIFGYRVAFTGHGYNHQSGKGSLGNRIKALYTGLADWWFPYTERVADFLAAEGYPRERMSVMNNSIDTRELAETAASMDPGEIASLKSELGIGTEPVGIYCGGMYPEKEIPFLLRACREIREKVPGFTMIFLGSGQDAGLVRTAAETTPWIHYPGAKFGREKVRYLMIADVFLMPGLVGLAILDAFALSLPMLTTRYPFHSPEIAYLEEGVNGMISDFESGAYAELVAQVLRNRELYQRLREGSSASSGKYSLERMVENISEGIRKSLKAK